MHLIKNYSFQSGQEIDKIHTFEKFFPGLPDKYIVIQPWSKAAKNYNNWEEVLELIFPILQKNNIAIVQVGAKDEKPLKFCMQTQGNTSWGQLEYIVSKSLLVLSTDSVSSHLGGHYNLPLVTLISNNYSDCVKPYFGDKSKQIILEPDREKLQPMFALDEPTPKQIDSIKPEQIVNSVCKLLNLEFIYPFNTLTLGQLYHNKMLESAVTDVIDIKKLGAQNLILRLDWNFNLVILQQQLAYNPCQLITDKEIPIQILQQFKPNILNVIYKITEKHNPDFIKTLITNKISYQLVSELPIEKLNPIKLDYIDFGVIVKINNDVPNELKDIDLEKVHIKSAKLILARQKFYICYRDYVIGREYNPAKPEPMRIINKDLNLLYLEKEFLYFLEKV